MKSPFASLNWGVHSAAPYVFTVSLYGASASRDEPAYLWSQPMQVYTDFASAFENLFQGAASQMDNRAEWFFDNYNTMGMTMEEISQELLGVPSTETPSVFDLQGFYNEAQRRANIGVPPPNPQAAMGGVGRGYRNFRAVCDTVWNRLSQLTEFESWDDYRNILRRTVSNAEREQLNQAFETYVELIPPMNLKTVVTFRTEYYDDYFSTDTRLYLNLLPRNLEGLN